MLQSSQPLPFTMFSPLQGDVEKLLQDKDCTTTAYKKFYSVWHQIELSCPGLIPQKEIQIDKKIATNSAFQLFSSSSGSGKRRKLATDTALKYNGNLLTSI